MEMEKRLTALEQSHRGLMAQCLALETLCMALLPLIQAPESTARTLLDLASATLADCMADDGLDASFRQAVEDRLETLLLDVLAAAPVVCRIGVVQ